MNWIFWTFLAIAEFGDEYRKYMQTVPAFFPHLTRHAEAQ